MGLVLVVGSANCDFVFNCPLLPRAGETVLGTDFSTFNGGKGANQAVAIGRLGGEVSFCGCVGRDLFGNGLRESLSASGVGVEFLSQVDISTGAAAVLVGADGANQIVVAPGANGAVSPEIVSAAMTGSKARTVLAQLEVPMSAVVAASFADRFILDPAPAAHLDAALLSRCFAITPNEPETEALTGIRPDGLESCRKAAVSLLDRGVRNVVITLGEKGCFWKSGNHESWMEPPVVKAVDTTAAGDAFSGALAHFLEEDLPFEEALRLSNCVAALSTTRSGAQASMPTRSQVVAFVGRSGLP